MVNGKHIVLDVVVRDRLRSLKTHFRETDCDVVVRLLDSFDSKVSYQRGVDEHRVLPDVIVPLQREVDVECSAVLDDGTVDDFGNKVFLETPFVDKRILKIKPSVNNDGDSRE